MRVVERESSGKVEGESNDCSREKVIEKTERKSSEKVERE